MDEAVKNFAKACKDAGENEPLSIGKLTEGYLIMSGIVSLLSKKVDQQSRDIELMSAVISNLVDADYERRGLDAPNLPPLN